MSHCAHFPRVGKPIILTTLTTAILIAASILTVEAQTFTQSSTLAGVWASSTTWADIDGDGDPDLLVTGLTGPAETCSPLTQLYVNQGGVLSASTDSFENIHLGQAAFGDYDGDGDLDLALSGATASGIGTLKLYENSGGSFTEDLSQTALLAENLRYSAIAWGDLDNDGDLDLIASGITTAGNPRTVLFRNGRIDAGRTGSPLGGFPIFAVDEPNSDRLINLYGGRLAWGDLDGDGDLDLAATGYGTDGSRQAVIYLNEPLGTLVQDTGNTDLTPVSGGDLAWADYDNDGDTDLVLSGWNASWEATLQLFTNAAGILREDRFFSATRVVGSIAWADFDNDGDLDLAVTGHSNTSEPATYIARNEPLGSLAEDPAVDLPGLRGGDVAWADSDGDGDLDLVLSGETATGERQTGIYTLSGVVANAPPQAPDRPGDPVVTGGGLALNWNDGQDVESGSSALTYVLRIGTSSGSHDVFSGVVSTGGSNVGSAKTVRLAIPLARDTYFWTIRAVDGGLTTSDESQEERFRVQDLVGSDQNLRPLQNGKMAWADYDDDGDADLLLSGLDIDRRARSILYENQTGRLIENSDITLQGVIDGDAAWGDFDNDGDLDLLLTGGDVAGNRFTHLYRNRQGDFALNVANFQILPQMSQSAAEFGDVDNDGDVDLVLMGQVAGERRTLLFRNDDEQFVEVVDASLTPTDNGDLAWGDYDNDGDLDLAVTGQQSNAGAAAVDLYRNDPTGTLSVDARSTLPSLLASTVAWGDYDSDGDLDLAAAGFDPTAQVLFTEIYENDGTGLLTGINAGLTGMAAGDLAWGDFDNDGDLDLALSGAVDGGQALQLYRNQNGVFGQEPIDVLIGASFSSLAWADIDSDDDLDLGSTGQTTKDGSSFLPSSRVNDNLESRFNPNRSPEAPDGLVATSIGSTVALSWLPGSDQGSSPTADDALSYHVRVGSTPDGNEIRSGATPVAFGEVRGSSLQLVDLESGTYFWSIRSVDLGFQTSSWTDEQSFIVDTVVPVVDSVQVRPRVLATGRRASVVINFLDEPAGMDNTITPTVTLQLTGIDDPLRLEQISYSGGLWIGEVEITEQTPGGTVIVRVEGAADLKGNVMTAFESVIPALIARGQGGVVQSSDGVARLGLSPNVLPETLSQNPDVKIEAVLINSAPSGATETSALAYEITSEPIFALRKPATFSIVIPERTTSDQLAIFRLDAGGWIRVGGTIEQRVVRVSISDFGTYGLFIGGSGAGGTGAISNIEFSNRAFSPAGGRSGPPGPGRGPAAAIQSLVASTDLSFDLGAPATVRVEVYDRGGRLQRVLEPGRPMNAGRNLLTWDGRDHRDEIVRSGLYIVVIDANGEQIEKTVAVVNR